MYALRLVGDGLAVWPPRGGDAAAKVDERFFRDVDAEGTDGAGRGDLSLRDGGLLLACGLRVAGSSEQEQAAGTGCHDGRHGQLLGA